MKYKVGDKVIVNPERSKRPGVFIITSISVSSPTSYKLSDSNGKSTGEWLAESIIKVPLFKVGQIVQFKDITKDRWYTGTDVMANLEGKLGIISEITEDNYTADKPGQDGCCYKVLYLQKGTQGYVTSACLEPVPTITSLDDISVTRGDDPGPRGDLGVVTTITEAMAQAVDNVKGPQFKIGDRVLIREDLVPGKKYEEWDYSPEDGMGGWEFAAAMAKYIGKVATITGYVADDPNYCHLDIDKGTYSWIVNALLHYTPGSDYDLDRTIITYKQTKQNYENRLQKSDSNLVRGSECKGRGVRYQENKAQIVSGHSCYTGKAVRC